MNEFFHKHFETIARAETRSMDLPKDSDGVPAGSYGFVESYCTEPGCDCRRVLLFVLSKEEGLVGVIGFGFDRSEPMSGPFLDPLHPHAPYAPALLQITKELVLSDPAYVARLERHYRMVKEKIARGAKGERARHWWRKPKKGKRGRAD